MKTIIKIFIIINTLMFIACTPAKRLTSLIEHHPELTALDTIKIQDKITIPLVEKDTLVSISSLATPLIVSKGRLEIKVQKVHDTLYLQGKCKQDTVYKMLTVPVEKIKMIQSDKTGALIARIPWLVAGFIALMLFGGLVVFKTKTR